MADPKRVAARWLEARVFQAPPRMVKAVADVVMEEWISRLLYLTENEELRTQLSRQYRVRPKPLPPRNEAIREVPVDLRGWRYEKIVRDARSRMSSAERESFDMFNMRDITVSTVFAPDVLSMSGECWGSSFVRVKVAYNIDSYKDFKYVRSKAMDITRHEVQHMGQQVLSNATKAEAGLPPARVREKGVSPSGHPEGKPFTEKEKIEHAHRDIEFYTRLQDEITRARKKRSRIPRKYWSWFVDNWVGDPQAPVPPRPNPYMSQEKVQAERDALKKRYRFNDKDLEAIRKIRRHAGHAVFFSMLLRHSKPKWRKAVKEFVKAVR